MTDQVDYSRPLPHPDDLEVRRLFSNRETREAYRFLYERRDDPPTMSDWTHRAAEILGKANVHTQRRLRDVRDFFVVSTTKQRGGDWVYHLEGWKLRPATDRQTRIDPRLEAEVYTKKGRFCAMCGFGPADGVKLQLDHIIPRSWGGETTYENLEPLCQRHNNGKRNFFESLSPYSEAIKKAIQGADPWQRIGELLKAFADSGEPTPVELIEVVARETNKGDPKKRLRELRYILGWDIRPRRTRINGVTSVVYELRSWEPWPPEGARAAVTEYERRRRST
jgi:hypothetical protein